MPDKLKTTTKKEIVEAESPYVAKLGFKLLSLGNPPTLASQNAGITGMSHHTQLEQAFLTTPVFGDYYSCYNFFFHITLFII